MKLAMFRVDTPVGPFDRFGIVALEGGPADTIESARNSADRDGKRLEAREKRLKAPG